MATGTNGSTAAPARSVIVRVVVVLRAYSSSSVCSPGDICRERTSSPTIRSNALFGVERHVVRAGKNVGRHGRSIRRSLAATVTLAMVAAALLAIPIAWIYTLTRARRGYQQSVVQLLIILPVVVAGIVVLVKYSLALAFSLGGIAAAVRFRNTLDDSKDAVYVFLVTGLGIAAAVDLPVALVISMLFNVVITSLWLTDFGRTPVALEGAHAERRLARARQLARTGTFVARIDDEVLKNMTSEQLEGVAQAAPGRVRASTTPTAWCGKGEARGSRDRVACATPTRIRPIVESQLDEATKRWSVDTVATSEDGMTVIDYTFVAEEEQRAGRAAVDVAGRRWCRSRRRRTPVVTSNLRPDHAQSAMGRAVEDRSRRVELLRDHRCRTRSCAAQGKAAERHGEGESQRRPRTAPRSRRTAASVATFFQSETPIDRDAHDEHQAHSRRQGRRRAVARRRRGPIAGADGAPVTIPVRIKTRGIWRLKTCEFPPIRLNFTSEAVKKHAVPRTR